MFVTYEDDDDEEDRPVYPYRWKTVSPTVKKRNFIKLGCVLPQQEEVFRQTPVTFCPLLSLTALLIDASLYTISQTTFQLILRPLLSTILSVW